jgi:hypothetical protein
MEGIGFQELARLRMEFEDNKVSVYIINNIRYIIVSEI